MKKMLVRNYPAPGDETMFREMVRFYELNILVVKNKKDFEFWGLREELGKLKSVLFELSIKFEDLE